MAWFRENQCQTFFLWIILEWVYRRCPRPGTGQTDRWHSFVTDILHFFQSPFLNFNLIGYTRARAGHWSARSAPLVFFDLLRNVSSRSCQSKDKHSLAAGTSEERLTTHWPFFLPDLKKETNFFVVSVLDRGDGQSFLKRVWRRLSTRLAPSATTIARLATI